MTKIKPRKVNKYNVVQHVLPVNGNVIEYQINVNGVRRIGVVEEDDGTMAMVVEFDDFAEPVLIPESELIVIS
jgi:hypothetical protein